MQARAVPIPIDAEMSSINPVLLMPAALAARGSALGGAFAQSVTMGVGQFCTNPGLLLAIEGERLKAFEEAAVAALAQAGAGRMLTGGIHEAYAQGAEALAGHNRVETLASGLVGEGDACGQAALFATSAEAFLDDPAPGHQVFGPSSLLVRCKDAETLLSASMDGDAFK